MKSFKKVMKGFTLIEMVVVIVVLGILAIIAVPKYIDLTEAATNAAGESTVAAIEAGSSINFAARTAVPDHSTPPASSSAVPGTMSCVAAVDALLGNNLDTVTFTVGAVTGTTVDAGGQDQPNGTVSKNCTLQWAGGPAGGSPITLLITS